MSSADRHVEHLKLDAVEQVLAVPIKDPLAGTGRRERMPTAEVSRRRTDESGKTIHGVAQHRAERAPEGTGSEDGPEGSPSGAPAATSLGQRDREPHAQHRDELERILRSPHQPVTRWMCCRAVVGGQAVGDAVWPH